MFSSLTNAILNSDILPSVNSTFWSGLGNVFTFVGSWLLQGLATIGYLLCRFALNLIDFMQFLVQKLAGLDVWMNLEKLDLNTLEETDVVFRFLLSDTVIEVFRTMFVIFLVLLIVFTIVGIIKNEYANATNGGDKLNDHKKVWFTAGKAFITVILVPFVLIAGILASNAILASLAKAFNVNNNMTIGGQVFVASAYDASSYRYYAKQGIRKYTSNIVNFKVNGTDYTVNSAITPLDPDAIKDGKPFTGYMFTYNAKDYYLWQCEESKAVDYYYYIKYILGAVVVEGNPERDSALVTNVANYNKNFVSIDAALKTKITDKWADISHAHKGSQSGFLSYALEMEKGDSPFIDAAYNTWSYNQVLQTNLSSWHNQSVSLDSSVYTFQTLVGTHREAKVITNSDAWAKLHDGGKFGLKPLSVEYLAMADVIDFMIENDVTLYYVNANNANINYQGGGLDAATRYVDDATGIPGLLVDYKNEGRVAYQIKPSVKSELDGAIYIVCYFDNSTNQYIPLVNNQAVVDAKGNKYTFKSSQYSADYNGAVIARAMFKSSDQARNCEPTYITTTMLADQRGADFDSKLATAVKLDYIANQFTYTYLKQLTEASYDNILIGDSYVSGNYEINKNVLAYYMTPETDASGANIEKSFTSIEDRALTKTETIIDPNTGEPTEVVSRTEFGELVEGIRDAVIANLYDETDSTYRYEYAEQLEVDSNYVITFKIKREGEINPQYHTVTLKLIEEDLSDPEKLIKNQELIDVAGGQLCKVYFDVKIELDGKEYNTQSLVNPLTINAATTVAEIDRLLFTEGDDIALYLAYQDGIGGGESGDDTFFGPTTYVDDNINLLVEEFLKLYGGSGYHYQLIGNYSREFIENPADENEPTRRIKFQMYRCNDCAPGAAHTAPYNHVKKYDVVLELKGRDKTDIELPSSATTESFMKHTFSRTVTPIVEEPTLAEYADTYNREHDGVYTDEIYGTYKRDGVINYYNTAASMLAANSQNVADSIAKGVAALINADDTTDTTKFATIKLLEDSVVSSGGVAFSVNNVGNLEIKFNLEFTNSDSSKYLAQVVLKIAKVTKTGTNLGTAAEPNYIYQYTFNYSYSIYNTFNAYDDNLSLTNIIKDTSDDPKALVFTVLDFEKKDKTANYITKEDNANPDNNEYQAVVQYTYKQVSKNSAVTYTFNAVKTGVKCDDGVEFVTLTAANTFKEISKDSAAYDETKLIFKLGKLRAVYMPEYSLVIEHADGSFTYAIIDSHNVTESLTYIYTLTMKQDLSSMPIVKNGNAYTYTGSIIKAYKYDGANVSEDTNTSTISVAAQYLYEHFQMHVYNVDMHGYQEIITKKVEGERTRYTAVLETTTGDTIALIATDVYYVGGTKETNFNDFLLEAEINGETYYRATSFATSSSVDFENPLSVNAAIAAHVDQIKNVLDKFNKLPVSVVFCRDEMSNMHWIADFKIHIWSKKEGFDFLWRGPKIGFATIQKNSAFDSNGKIVDNVQLSLLRGKVELDYNFNGNVALGNVYLVTDLNWIIFIFSIALIFNILGKAVWGLISRIYQITLLFLIMPAVASTLPIDSKGSRFDSWKNKLISQVLGAYGVTIGLNFFFIIIPVIREASAIFTDADLVGMTGTLKFLAGSADRLNYLCYILFLLVSFTLLNSVPKLVQEFTGFKDGDVIKQGEDTKKSVVSSVKEAGDAMSGAGIINAGHSLEGMVKPFLTPGSAFIKTGKDIYDKYSGKRKARKAAQDQAMEAARNQAAEERKKENEKIAAENAQNKIDEANKKMQNDAQQNAEAAENAATANVAEGLTTDATQQVAQEVAAQQQDKDSKAVNDAQRYAEASKLYAQSAQESANIATGNVHDYVGDRKEAEAAAKQQEKEDRKHRDSRAEKAEAAANKADEAVIKAQEQMKADKGKGVLKLSAEDIDAFNERHKNDEDFVALVKKGDKDYNSKEQKIARAQAKQEKHLENLVEEAGRKRLIADDAKDHVYRGLRGSFVRTFLSGQKTREQIMKEALLKRELDDQLGADRKDKAKIEAIFNETDPSKAKSWKTLEKMKNELMQTEAGKKVASEYDFYIKSEGELGRKGMDVRREALERMRQKAMAIANDKIEDTTVKLNKAKAAAADDRSGAMHFVGKHAKELGQVLASKGSAVFTAIRNTGKVSKLLGSTDEVKERTGVLLGQERSDREKLRKDALNDYKELMASKAYASEDKIRKDMTEKVVSDDKTAERIAKYLQADKHLANVETAQEEYRAEMKKYRSLRKKGNNDSAWQILQNAAQSGKLNGTKLLDTFNAINGDLSSGKLKNAAEAVNEFQKSYQKVNHKKNLEGIADYINQSTKDKLFGNAIDRAVADEQRKRSQDVAIKQKKYETSKANYKKISEQIVKHYGQFTEVGLINKMKNDAADRAQEKQEKARIKQEVKTAKKIAKQQAKDDNNIKLQASRRAAKSAEQIIKSSKDAQQYKEIKAEKTIERLLSERDSQARKALIKELDNKAKNSKFLSADSKADLAKLVKKMRANETLSDTERKRVEHYANITAARSKAKSETATAKKAENAKTAAALEARAKKEYAALLQKELESAKLETKLVNRIVNKMKQTSMTPSQVAKMTKTELDKAIKDKQSEFMAKAGRNSANSKELISEINQLKSLVSKLKTTDSTYKVSLRKLKESNRKLAKQMKNQKSANALKQATSAKNSFGDNASGK